MLVSSIGMEVLINSLKLVLELGLIITTVMVVIEFLQEYQILHRLTALADPVTRLLKLPRAANLPLLAGIFLGISFGAAVIIDSGRNGSLAKEDIYLINLFLVICHSMVEDTIIWMALGAIIIPVQIARLLVAIIICYLASKFVQKYRKPLLVSINNTNK